MPRTSRAWRTAAGACVGAVQGRTAGRRRRRPGSWTDYYRHHLAALSSALVFADTTTLLDKAASLGLGVVNDARASAPE